MQEIYDEYYSKIYNWSLNKTHKKEDAEDLTNSVFLAIFEYLNKNIKVEKLENLIWKIAYNMWCTKAKNYIKEKENVTLDEKYQIGNSENMVDKIIYKEIIESIDKVGLTEKENKAFRLYYIDDLSIKEIGNILNTTESNIKYYLYNARNKIKEKYYE